ncbi:Alpha/Beta hydrolase protein [Bombardia bombarda]|uniref:Alpha/Beta hydrolase protein n=1 Tax=Bombardia bombarda TaxID=252184 RepID=A0AA39XBS1_9PEZI|nr:Alpha/Beta hydrolase protein [Bombardia bombarda]
MASPLPSYVNFTTNDGCKIAFRSSLPLPPSREATPSPNYSRLILLMHGFSGSSAYFARNIPTLSSHSWVVAPDMRGHGASGRPAGGYHVARLAADLRELIAHLRAAASSSNLRIVPVGCSIGAAVLWTYVELFGCADFAGFVFVDQAPLQDQSLLCGRDDWDETRCHTGCYDEKSMLGAQEAWVLEDRRAETHRGLVGECLGYRQAGYMGREVSEEEREKDEEYFTGISALCDGVWLARLLADHTRYDHREAIELIDVPTLVMAGKWSGCFPLEGMKETVRRVEKMGDMEGKVKMSLFDCGHWLFWEDPERFGREVMGFVDSLELK